MRPAKFSRNGRNPLQARGLMELEEEPSTKHLTSRYLPINLSASVDKLSRSHREWLRDWPDDATATGCSAICNDQVPIPAWTGCGSRKDGKSLRSFSDLFSTGEKGF